MKKLITVAVAGLIGLNAYTQDQAKMEKVNYYPQASSDYDVLYAVGKNIQYWT